jgi:hypothetical protein
VEERRVADGFLAHQGSIGIAGVVAISLFLAAWPLGFGAWTLLTPPSAGLRRVEGIGLGALAAGCLCVATALPFFIRPGPSVFRPRTTATIRVISPRPNEVIRADQVQVAVRVEGGRVVPFTSTTLVPNEGHVHISLDGRLVSMLAGTTTIVPVSPGEHTLQVEFVAIDHGSFDPRVRASVTFRVAQPLPSPAGT